MTPDAIRVAEGPALDAFVLERVCGWTKYTDGPFSGWWCVPSEPDYATNPNHAPELSSDDAACWQWVVPALVAKWWWVRIASCGANECGWHATVEAQRGEVREYQAEARTPALAITRAAALTVAEGEE